MNVTGLWDYSADVTPRAYGDDTTYRLGMDWLESCATVEDWGCGAGYARQFRRGAYTGIDGSPSRFADKVADLREYRSSPDGIFMRHVLEHNDDWQPILAGAVASFRKRMALIIFTPFAATTKVISFGFVPDISFRREDLTRFLVGLTVTEQPVTTNTWYGAEHVFYIERPGGAPDA